MESEGTVVFACVADHPNQLQVTLFGLLICDMAKKLERGKKREGKKYRNYICNMTSQIFNSLSSSAGKKNLVYVYSTGTTAATLLTK